MSVEDIEWPETFVDALQSTRQNTEHPTTHEMNLLQSSSVTGPTMSTVRTTVTAISQITTKAVTKATEILNSTTETIATSVGEDVTNTSTESTTMESDKITATSGTITEETTLTIMSSTITEKSATSLADTIVTSSTNQDSPSTTESMLGQIQNMLNSQINSPDPAVDADSDHDLTIQENFTIYIIVAAVLLVSLLLVVGLYITYKKHKRCHKAHESYNVRVSELNEYSPSPIKSDPESCKM